MISLALAAMMVAATPEAQPIRLAVPGLTVAGMDAGLAEPFTEHVATHLQRQGAKAVTPREISAVLGLERQKVLLGCADQGSCLAEIANALGVDAVVMGGVTRVGSLYQLHLRAVSPTDASTLGDWQRRLTREEDIFPAFEEGARSIALALARTLGRPVPQPEANAARPWVLPTGITGAVLAGAGGVALVLAGNEHAQLAEPSRHLSLAEAGQMRDRGNMFQTLGWVGVGVGAAGLVTAGVLAVVGGEPDTTVTPSVRVEHGTTTFFVTGRFP